MLGIIPGFQGKFVECFPAVVMVINCLTFHPRVICVPRIVYITLKYLQVKYNTWSVELTVSYNWINIFWNLPQNSLLIGIFIVCCKQDFMMRLERANPRQDLENLWCEWKMEVRRSKLKRTLVMIMIAFPDNLYVCLSVTFTSVGLVMTNTGRYDLMKTKPT